MFASKASTQLMTAWANGKKISTATFTLRKAGSEQQEYMTITLSEVYITSYNISGPTTEAKGHEKSRDEDRENPVPIEEITLSFEKIEVHYRGQKASGDLAGKLLFIYNLPNARSK